MIYIFESLTPLVHKNVCAKKVRNVKASHFSCFFIEIYDGLDNLWFFKKNFYVKYYKGKKTRMQDFQFEISQHKWYFSQLF